MILVTGAAGKTGQAVTRALAQRGQRVRALIRQEAMRDRALEAGAAEIIIGDMRDADDMARAMEGASAIYHLAPNVSPYEEEMGRLATKTANQQDVGLFVYHSVLHPQTEAMPHHWRKLRVEEILLEAGLNYVILQPAAYMQNIFGQWQSIADDGIYSVPYALRATISMVDLEDVAAAAAEALTNPSLVDGTYELAGPDALDQNEVANQLSLALGRPVAAKTIPREKWEEQAQASDLAEEAINTLVAMFHYYDQFGMRGSPHVLASLLGRPPTNFATFLQRTLQNHSG